MKKLKKYIKIECKYCKKLFFKYDKKYRKRKFCSKECVNKYNGLKMTKNYKKRCELCNKYFKLTYNNERKKRRFCSYKCYEKYKHRGMFGGILFFKCDYCGKKISRFKSVKKTKYHYCDKKCYLKAIYAKIKLRCDNCDKKYLYNKKMSIGYKLHFCSIKCKKIYFKLYPILIGDKNPMKKLNVRKKVSKAKTGVLRFNMRGEKNPAWQGGVSRLPYAFDFDNELKKLIRKRDNYKCQLCGAPQEEFIKKLHVHHIDYDKLNSNPLNLITLCITCNIKVNINRDYWTNFFNKRMETVYVMDS